jgi:hypothetical protein
MILKQTCGTLVGNQAAALGSGPFAKAQKNVRPAGECRRQITSANFPGSFRAA